MGIEKFCLFLFLIVVGRNSSLFFAPLSNFALRRLQISRAGDWRRRRLQIDAAAPRRLDARSGAVKPAPIPNPDNSAKYLIPLGQIQ